MDTKSMLASKTFWAAALAIGAGLNDIFITKDVSAGMEKITLGLGMWGIRTGTKEIR